MDCFKYRKGILYCEACSVKSIARKYQTPFFLYSRKAIEQNFFALKRAFAGINPLICYSVKANSNLSILKFLVKSGAGLDIVSGGELYRARKVRCPSNKIVYASVGKAEEEIRQALKEGILMFNVESENELEAINRCAKKAHKKVKVSLRLNPGVRSNTHEYIITGAKRTKFGIAQKTARDIICKQKKYKNTLIAGIHLHIGSQINQTRPFVSAIKKTREFINSLPKKINLEFLNIGGGLGIAYGDEASPTAGEFAAAVVPLLKSTGLKMILEPGRFITGNAGILVAKVLYNKSNYNKRYIVVDAAMNDFIRPSLYSAYHKIEPVDKGDSSFSRRRTRPADIVGPVCESGDFLGKNRKIRVKPGSYLAVFGAGAYGFSMSSNYNSRRRPPEILVKGRTAYRIRKRESYQNLIDNEIIIT